jgi:hypothetical protein
LFPILECDLSKGSGPPILISDRFVDLHCLFEVAHLSITNRDLCEFD